MSAESPDRRRCGVLGSPIGHSLSPVLHRAAYRALGRDWAYDAHDVGIAELAGFFADLTPEWRGLSLTMPLKREVIAFCDRVESLGAMLESINTVVIEPDGTRVGYNTDVVGFVRALRDAGVHRIETAVVIGAGATAASALAALGQLGADRATVLARTPAKGEPLRAVGPALGVDVALRDLAEIGVLDATDVIVSTVPADAQPPLATAAARLAPVVFDVIYHPAATPMLNAARETGATAIPGFELLVHQAARQVELMVGVRRAPIDAMRTEGLAALGNQ